MEPQANTPLYGTTGNHLRRVLVWVEVHMRGLFGAPEVSGVYTWHQTWDGGLGGGPPIPIPNRYLVGPLLTSGASPTVPMYKQIALLRGNSV